MPDLIKLHNDVYELLMSYREKDPACHFTFRKSNRNNKLEEGYWFYGDEEYVAISFWSGMDWKNKTPNIIFVMHAGSGEANLEINTSDSGEKRSFVVRFLVGPLRMASFGQRYQKTYTANGEFLMTLRNFLETDKLLIDDIIRKESEPFFKAGDQEIGFIASTQFEEEWQKVNAYRELLQRRSFRQEQPDSGNIPHRLQSVHILNFGPIRNIAIDDIGFLNQWIFFTGENGTGKTSLLRALATALCGRPTQLEEMIIDQPLQLNLTLYITDQQTIYYKRTGNIDREEQKILVTGFAAYGQSRLRTGYDEKIAKETRMNVSETLYASLFNNDSSLIDLQQQFDAWRENSAQSSVYEKRKSYITEILTDILPNLYNINFEDTVDGQPVTSYIEKDHEGGAFKKVSFNQLASGLKSMIAMIGDIMVRLYDQQPETLDPAEFRGIVIIDEIDIHLHPKLQKELVEQLTRTFPKIQFIASTHSPISLLGAPKHSLIFKVERNVQQGVAIHRLDDKLILGDLLPNTILTSPIFGLQDIVPNSHDSDRIVRTETSYTEVEFNNEVKRKINEFLTDEKEQQLINLFKSRKL